MLPSRRRRPGRTTTHTCAASARRYLDTRRDRPGRRGWWLPVLVLVIATLGLAGCASTGGGAARGAAGGDGSTSGPAKGRTLRIATSFPITDLDPVKNGFWGPEFGYVELLMRPQRDGNPTPWVLKELRRVDDRTWDLQLNDGVRFWNGKPFDAAALVKLLDFMGKENTGFAGASAYGGASATGPLEVRLTTTRPVPSMANVLADEANVPVVDIEAYQRHLADKAAPAALVTAGIYTGPYEVTALTSQQATLRARSDHWSGTPALDGVTLRFVPQASARVQAVQAGEVDLALYLPTSTAKTLQGRTDAFYVQGTPTGTTFALQVNQASPPTNDVRIRRAVLTGIDYRALADNVLNGLAGVAESPYSPNLPYAVKTQVTDPGAAQALLDEAGWRRDAQGQRTKDGQPLRLSLLCYPQQPDSITLAVAIQAQLAQLGVTVDVKQVNDLSAARKQPGWNLAIAGASLLSFGMSPEEALTDNLRSGGEHNWGKIADPKMDALIDKLGTTFDQTQRHDLLREIQQRIWDDGIWAATVMRRPAVVTNAAWRDYEPPVANMWVTADTGR